MKPNLTRACLASIVLDATAFAGDNDKKAIAPPPEDSWEFKLSLPGWIPWLSGDTGINGVVSHIDLGPNDIIPKLDMVADVRAEAHKGRFSLMGEFLYMSLSDGKAQDGAIKKLDVQVDQTMGDLGVAWRLIESPRGYLDVTAGVRYMNFYQRLAIQPNDERIDNASTHFVDAVAGRIGDRLLGALAESDFRDKVGGAVSDRIDSLLGALQDRDPVLPEGPIGDRLRGQIAAAILRLVEENKASVSAVIKQKGLTTAAAIRAEVEAGKARLSDRIAGVLHDKLDTIVSRTDDWWDPYIGLRARYNLNEKFYLTAKADIGGFTIGSDLSWTAEAALGCQLSRNIYTEIGFRAMGVDYEKNGLLMDTVTYGPQVTMGINF